MPCHVCVLTGVRCHVPCHVCVLIAAVWHVSYAMLRVRADRCHVPCHVCVLAGTVTGRLSSHHPNMQNLPKHEQGSGYGQALRRTFVPEVIVGLQLLSVVFTVKSVGDVHRYKCFAACTCIMLTLAYIAHPGFVGFISCVDTTCDLHSVLC